MDIKEWNDDVALYLLSRLAPTCNKHLLPSIKCPWVFPAQSWIITMHMKSDLEMKKKVLFIQEDYIRDEDDEEDCWLFNKNWLKSPPIAFIEGRGPTILTCSDHNN